MTEFNQDDLTPDQFRSQRSFTEEVEEIAYDFTKDSILPNLLPGYRYIVRVRALNNYNVYSEWSEALDFAVPADATIPSQANSLSATFSNLDVVVSWTPPSTNTDGSSISDISYYQIEFVSDTGTKVYNSFVNSFTLTYAVNVADFGLAGYGAPDFDITVYTVDTSGNISEGVTTSVSHTDPTDPPEDPVLIASINGVNIQMATDGIFDSLSSLVYYTFELHESTDDGVGDPYAVIYSGSSSTFEHTVSPGTLHYYKYLIIDPFGYETAFSDAVSTTSTISPSDIDYTTIFMFMGA